MSDIIRQKAAYRQSNIYDGNQYTLTAGNCLTLTSSTLWVDCIIKDDKQKENKINQLRKRIIIVQCEYFLWNNVSNDCVLLFERKVC